MPDFQLSFVRLKGEKVETVTIDVATEERLSKCDAIIIQIINRGQSSYSFSFIRSPFVSKKCDVPVRLTKQGDYVVVLYAVHQNTTSDSDYFIVDGSSECPLDLSTNKFNISMGQKEEYKVFTTQDHIPFTADFCGFSNNLSNFKEEHIILFLKQNYPSVLFIMIKDKYKSSLRLPPILPVTHYELFQFEIGEVSPNFFIGKGSVKLLKWYSYMRKAELQELYNKAQIFNSNHQKWTVIKHVYRNKFRSHFHHIFNQKKGVMEVYAKNFGGDQGSCINGRLNGLFFSTFVSPQNLQRPAISYFGDVRLILPIYVLINRDTNLYFSDFYCHYKNHKVQIVVTKADSEEDKFCKTNLIPLYKFQNPFFFLFLTNNLRIRASVRIDVTVELFFTSDIDIPHLMRIHPGKVWMESTKCEGNAYKMVTGIPKREDCDVCNLEIVKARRYALAQKKRLEI